ncbi:hypothetical protein [Caudoviricetes sp.]|nr:hypothetical protein [Caudoviricetes sp.]
MQGAKNKRKSCDSNIKIKGARKNVNFVVAACFLSIQ